MNCAGFRSSSLVVSSPTFRRPSGVCHTSPDRARPVRFAGARERPGARVSSFPPQEQTRATPSAWPAAVPVDWERRLRSSRRDVTLKRQVELLAQQFVFGLRGLQRGQQFLQVFRFFQGGPRFIACEGQIGVGRVHSIAMKKFSADPTAFFALLQSRRQEQQLFTVPLWPGHVRR